MQKFLLDQEIEKIEENFPGIVEAFKESFIPDVEPKPDNYIHGKPPYIVDAKYIVNIKGKDAIIYRGLLDAGHYYGMLGVESEILQYPNEENKWTTICKGTVTTKEGKPYSSIGDANPKNVNKMVVEHTIRMADTRAKARALRDFTNISIVCYEELDLDPETGNGNNGYKKDYVDAKLPVLKREVIKQLLKTEIISDCHCKTPADCDHDKRRVNDKLNEYGVNQLQDLVNMFHNEEIKSAEDYLAALKKIKKGE